MFEKNDVLKVVYKKISAAVIENKSLIIAANWKMNKNTTEITEFLNNLNKISWNGKNTVILFPPYPYLYLTRDILRYSKVLYGMQNVHWEDSGAFTGEVSCSMAHDFGCKYVIIGHSERRNIFFETDEILKRKLEEVFKHNLFLIFCVGEKLDERKDNRFKEVIKNQIVKGLGTTSCEDLQKIIIAYEPVWAIGTGLNATPDQVEEVHSYIKDLLKELYGLTVARKMPILYGGSAKAGNVREIALANEVSGFLIGGASLKIDEFSQIISLLE